jgi:hypothetical protein
MNSLFLIFLMEVRMERGFPLVRTSRYSKVEGRK